MAAPAQYADYGVRTRRGLFCFAAALLIAHLCLQLVMSARSGWTPAILAGIAWTALLMIVTARSLRRLEALEREHPQPTASMKLAFNLILLVPIVGTVPLLFLSLRGPVGG